MRGHRDTGRPQHRSSAAEQPTPAARWRFVAGGLIVMGVLAAGLFIGFGDFLGRPDTAASGAAIPVRLSMAGFTPGVIQAKPGETLVLELWTTDAAPHLRDGVHTLISDELGVYEELRAESRRTVTLTMPTAAGDYDIYCDTCCGGRASPTMHGTIRVLEA